MTRFDRTKLKTARARTLRKNATRPEQRLWFHLCGSKMNGYSFRRQHPVGPYILDFYCPVAKLAVELDGEQHGFAKGLAHDRARDEFLKRKDIRVLRFSNYQMKQSLESVLDGISRALHETPTRSPSARALPLSGGGNENAMR